VRNRRRHRACLRCISGQHEIALVAIDNEIRGAHGRLTPWQLAMVRPRISLFWRVSLAPASIFACSFVALEISLRRFLLARLEVVTHGTAYVGRAGQTARIGHCPPICRARISVRQNRVLKPSLRVRKSAAGENLKPGAFRTEVASRSKCPTSPVISHFRIANSASFRVKVLLPVNPPRENSPNRSRHICVALLISAMFRRFECGKAKLCERTTAAKNSAKRSSPAQTRKKGVSVPWKLKVCGRTAKVS